MIGDLVQGALPMLREQAESLMTDRATVERPNGTMVEGSGAAADTAGFDTVATNYPLRLRSFEPFETSVEAGGATVTVQRPAARFPVSATYVPKPGDRVTITASDDPSLVDRIFRVATTPQNTHSTAFRVYVDEVTA